MTRPIILAAAMRREIREAGPVEIALAVALLASLIGFGLIIFMDWLTS